MHGEVLLVGDVRLFGVEMDSALPACPLDEYLDETGHAAARVLGPGVAQGRASGSTRHSWTRSSRCSSLQTSLPHGRARQRHADELSAATGTGSHGSGARAGTVPSGPALPRRMLTVDQRHKGGVSF